MQDSEENQTFFKIVNGVLLLVKLLLGTLYCTLRGELSICLYLNIKKKVNNASSRILLL